MYLSVVIYFQEHINFMEHNIPITVESHNYAPHLLCMLALGKTGDWAYVRDSDIYM